MCYSDDARPPLPPVIGGAAADHGDITLSAADGNRLLAHYARAASPNGAGMVILPDVRGLHLFYKELAQRFAEAGFEAIALDYFGRTATNPNRDEGFEFRSHIEKTTQETIAADVRACVEYLKTPEGGRPRAIFSVGFCFGGAKSWSQLAHGHGLAGAAGFYGGQPEQLIPLIPQMKGELLMLLAGQDFTKPEQFRAVEEKLTEGGVKVESHTYPDAPHSFFDRSYAEHAAACEDAWRRILSFTARLTPQA
ncbi:MAG: dienelactone hydrolase family protein [Candidatus Dormibacteraeota bacterium]|nr:dienelactone hydrolase family protein [Candidatus Dormibacteraeota bacterium]